MKSTKSNTAIVSLTGLALLGDARSPWEVVRDAIAERLGVEPNAVAIEDISVAPYHFGTLREKTRAWSTIYLKPSRNPDDYPQGQVARGATPGFAYYGRRVGGAR